MVFGKQLKDKSVASRMFNVEKDNLLRPKAKHISDNCNFLLYVIINQ